MKGDVNMKKEYIENDLENPKYLFHGSPKLLETIEQRQSHDSNGNKDNEDFAVFLTSSFIIASAYAFKDKIKEESYDLNWNFDFGINNSGEIYIDMDNVRINDDLIGYIYVFPFNDSYEHNNKSIQYKCYENITPIDVIEVRLKEFKSFYNITNEEHKIM